MIIKLEFTKSFLAKMFIFLRGLLSRPAVLFAKQELVIYLLGKAKLQKWYKEFRLANRLIKYLYK